MMTVIIDKIMPCIGICGRCILMRGHMRDILDQNEETVCAGFCR
jgi:hypothetical protein